MGPCFYPIERFLQLKKPQRWMVRGFSGWTVRSGPGFKTLILFSPLVFCILSYIMRHHVLDHVRYKWMDIHRRIWSIMFLKNFRAKKNIYFKVERWIITAHLGVTIISRKFLWGEGIKVKIQVFKNKFYTHTLRLG